MASAGQSPARILVVDDNIPLAQGFGRALKMAGYDILLAHRADVALQLAQDHQPDAIILDFKMPFVNGVGFLYRLRELNAGPRTPVLVVTGESLNEDTQIALHDLDARVRIKPIGLADLISETRILVQHRYYNQAFEHAIGGLPRI